MKRAITDRVTAGSISPSPRATTRTAASRSSAAGILSAGLVWVAVSLPAWLATREPEPATA